MPIFQNPSQTSQGKVEDFCLQLARGHISNHRHVHKTGYISSGFSNGDTIWDDGSAYPWSVLNTATTITVAGATNQVSDRNLPIVIQGLDSNYKEITEEIRLNASNSSTPVTSTKTFLRINNAFINNGTTNTARIVFKVGDTTIYNISDGYGTSQVSIYTVPAGKTAYLIKGVASGTASTTIGFYIRLLNEGFKLQHIAIVDNSTYVYDFTIPLPFPEKTDMDIRGVIASGRVAVNWDMILIDN